MTDARPTAPLSFLLPAASGALLAASAPPALSPLAPFLALAPLAVWARALPAGPRGALAAASGGMLVGVLQHAWGLRWLPGTLGAVAGRTVGWLAFAAILGVLGACTAAAVTALHRLTHRARPVPLALALPASWTALEWALAHLPFGWAFPWAPLGLGLARWPGTIGIAELIGVGGVTAWLAAVSGMTGQAAALWADRDGGSGRKGALLLAGAVLLALVPIEGGLVRLRTLPVRAVGRVAAVALAVPPRAPAAARAELGVAQTENALAALTDPDVALAVLPEMTLPLDPAAPAGEPFRARLAAAAASLGAPLLVGVLGVAGGQAYNSALLVGGGEPDGAPAFRADKRRLVPGVERVSAVQAPWLAPWLAPSQSGYDPGEGWPVARVGGMGVGALVCYEVAFAEDARRLVAGGADVLAAVTSDVWFGEGALRRAGIAQQTAHLTMRVLETRTGAVRASNGGPALVIAPTGRVVAAADAGAVVGPVGAVERPTLFVRTGDLAGPAAAVVLLALLWVE